MPSQCSLCCLAGILLGICNLVSAGTLSVTLVDEHDTPTAARAYLRDAAGAAFFAPQSIVYDKVRSDGMSERHFVPPGGHFRIDLAAGRYSLVVERGKEYEPLAQMIDIPNGGVVERTFKLTRWIDMAKLGWYCGDMHAHRPLKDLAVLMEGDDLNIAIPLTRWRHTGNISEDPDLAAFLARADADGFLQLAPRRFIPVIAEELEPDNSALLVSHLGRTGTGLLYPLARHGLLARQRGALVDCEKATALDMPIFAALGACDTIGLTNNHFWRDGGNVGPWGTWPAHVLGEHPRTPMGFAQAGFDLYAALLDMGFRVVPSAGSASGVHPVPLGWSRVYVHVAGELTPGKWYDALRKGRSFVTTGPMLMLTVAGHEPGDEIRSADFPLKVEATIEMHSLKPIESAELVVNGKPQSVPLTPSATLPHTYQGRVSLTLDTNTWLAARWLGVRDRPCDAAHTGPIYFWKNNEPIPVPRREAEYFLDRVTRLLAEIDTGKTAETAKPRPTSVVLQPPEVREDTRKLFLEAQEIYRRKVAESR